MLVVIFLGLHLFMGRWMWSWEELRGLFLREAEYQELCLCIPKNLKSIVRRTLDCEPKLNLAKFKTFLSHNLILVKQTQKSRFRDKEGGLRQTLPFYCKLLKPILLLSSLLIDFINTAIPVLSDLSCLGCSDYLFCSEELPL